MLYLASQSPRRRDLLAQLGVSFGLLDVDVPERREPGESPADYVSRVAREKALPFEPLVPNETTIAAMREARVGNLKSFDSVGALMADLHADD